MMHPFGSRHRVAVELSMVARKPRPTRETRSVSRPIAHGFLDRGRRRTPFESGSLSTSSESSSVLGAMTGAVEGSTDKARGGFSMYPLLCAVDVDCFQEEKLPERRLRADWERRSKLVRLLSEAMEGL